jgi:hypothetical protein
MYKKSELTNDEIRFLIELMIWSFSRLNAFYNCPYEWKRKYIDGENGEGSFYSEYGSLFHSLLEQYLKGNVERKGLKDYYSDKWGEYIEHDLMTKDGEIDFEKEQQYYDLGLEYIDHHLPDLSKYNILGVEKKVEFEVAGFSMIGFIDLLLEDKKTGEITIWDHKSSAMKFKKNGEPYKSEEQHWKDFQRQLYLYSVPILEEYGRVDYLSWNLFRQGYVKTIPWNQADFEEARSWAVETIDKISQEENWEPKEDFFYCRNLCGFRDSCPVMNKENEERDGWWTN